MAATNPPVGARCECKSANHDHRPGLCPRPHAADNNLCEYCGEKIREVLEREAFRLGVDTLGSSRPLGDAPSFPFGEGFAEAFEGRGEAGEAPETPKGRVFNVGVAEMLEANDTVEATGTIGANIDVGGVAEVLVVPPIWHDNNRFNVFLEIDRAQRELEATRGVLLTLEAVRAENPRAHNGPPGLLDEPGIDIETIDSALACLVVLRKVVVQPQPDFDVIRLLWNVISATLKALGRFLAWLFQATLATLKPIWESKFGQGVLQGAGLVVGKHIMEEVLQQLIAHGPQGLQAVEQMLLHALTNI